MNRTVPPSLFASVLSVSIRTSLDNVTMPLNRTESPEVLTVSTFPGPPLNTIPLA